MEFVDTHAHLYSPKFEDAAEVLHRTFEAGVKRVYMPNVDTGTIDSMLRIENSYPGQCFAMMGLHPCSVNAGLEEELKTVESWLEKRDFVAIGEIGTDLYWDKSFLEKQKEAFKIQCGWAKSKNIPIVIHCRESMDLTIGLVEQLKDENLTGVFHCFNGTLDQARRIIDLGFFLGIGGVSTFKNGGLDTVIPEIPLSVLVLETDAPYLAPVPYRGKRNEPSYVPLIAQRVADLSGETLAAVAKTTTDNANILFHYQPK